jgi:hypothetical protein
MAIRRANSTDRTSGSESDADVWFLGPQYHEPNLGVVFDSLDLPDGRVAVVTAGWQEREGEDEEIDTLVGGRSLDLELYRRAERVFRDDPELSKAHRETQKLLHELERLYDLRLSFVLEAVRRLLRANGPSQLIEAERDDAVRQLRELDAWHLERVLSIRGEFETEWKPLERDAVARERKELRTLLDEAPALVIAGGHVAVLLNRMRLLGFGELAHGRTVIAWSAGAMVLTDRVVLFHDHPPQGPGNAEVLEEGFCLCKGIVALPDANKRLELDNPHRVASFARRFHPDACIVMGDGDAMHWNGESWTARSPARRLSRDGTIAEVTSW